MVVLFCQLDCTVTVLSILYVLLLILITVTHNYFLEYDEDGSEISQRQLQEHPEWTRHE